MVRYNGVMKPWMHYADGLGEEYADRHVCAHCGREFYGEAYGEEHTFCSEECETDWSMYHETDA